MLNDSNVQANSHSTKIRSFEIITVPPIQQPYLLSIISPNGQHGHHSRKSCDLSTQEYVSGVSTRRKVTNQSSGLAENNAYPLILYHFFMMSVCLELFVGDCKIFHALAVVHTHRPKKNLI